MRNRKWFSKALAVTLSATLLPWTPLQASAGTAEPEDVWEDSDTKESTSVWGLQGGSKGESQGSWTVPQSNITAEAESYEKGNEPGKAIDGNAGTWWHTSWTDPKDLPQSITLKLSEAAEGLCQLRYTPRNDKDINGTITEFKVETSYDGKNYAEVAKGTWAADKTEKSASFDALPEQVAAVRLTAYASAGNKDAENNKFASAAEINLVCDKAFKKDKSSLSQALSQGKEYIAGHPGLALVRLKELVAMGEGVLGDPLATQEGYEDAAAEIQELLGNIGTKSAFSGNIGARLYTADGELVQAHGGQISKWGDTYYWYGEDKTDRLKPIGVHLYTSKDLYNWEDCGLVMKTMKSKDEFEEEYFKGLYGSLTEEEKEKLFVHIDYNTAVVERPKVIYNAKTGKYVMWYHADGPWYGGAAQSYEKAMAAVAVADKPQGPFRVLGASRLHTSPDYTGKEKDYGMARDMNLFVDDDGTGYIIYASENNETMYISKLNEEYTDLAVRDGAVEGVDYSRNFVKAKREAPAMFQYKGKYYLMTSGCTGWDPNPAEYAVADSPLGPWTRKENPCIGEKSDTTFDTQSTCIFPVDAANGRFIYMGDRWFNPVKGKDLGDSRYVWLPVEFGENDTMAIRPLENWTLESVWPDIKPKEYAIRYELDGGSNHPDNPSAYTKGQNIPFKDPVRQGYAFQGWYTDSGLQHKIAGITEDMAGDLQLYAGWEKEKEEEIKVAKIILNPTAKKIARGKQFTLKASFLPENASNTKITWSSSNQKVATVTGGIVKAVGPGTAVITAAAADGSNVTAQCKISVPYKITYQMNNGKNHKGNPASYLNQAVRLKKPARKGYLFQGWYADSKWKKEITAIAKSSKKDITVYAKWSKVTVKKAKLASVKSRQKGKMELKVQKVSGAKGYEIRYSQNHKFKNYKKAAATKNSITIKGLSRNKTYYVKVRAYRMDSANQKIYGKFSAVKPVKIK